MKLLLSNYFLSTAFEYAIGPLFLIFATVCIRVLSKRNTRLDWKVALDIGLDVMMMTFFGAFVYAVSVFNHFSNHPAKADVMFVCGAFAIIVLVLSLILAVLLRFKWKDYPKSFWWPNVLASLALIGLMFVVWVGNEILNNRNLPALPNVGQITNESNGFAVVIAVLIGSLLGFFLSYLFARKIGYKAYEPDLMSAQLALQKHKYEKAIGLFGDVLAEIDSSNKFYIGTLIGMHLAYVGTKDYENAETFLNKALSSANEGKDKIAKKQVLKLQTEFEQTRKSDSGPEVIKV